MMGLSCATPSGGGSAFSGAKMYLNSPDTINTAIEKAITFDSIAYDHGGYIDAGKTKFTIPVAGVYLIGCEVHALDNSGTPTTAYLTIKINGVGSGQSGATRIDVANPEGEGPPAISEYELTAGAVVTFTVDARIAASPDFLYNAAAFISYRGSP